ncbi:MAG: cysteine--tRNA ligase, partial [Patescibacteria group bacterium]
ARDNQTTVKNIINRYTSAFFNDLSELNIKTVATEFPRASAHITEQIDLIKKLEEKGIAYKTSKGVYFNTAKYEAYADLAHLNLSGQTEGARVEVNSEKINATDFALWKFSKPDETRQQEWPSPWGVGFPGWHIECSAMSMKYLGAHFDIHTGGEDHIPVHHTNERAQSECATGQTFVNYWLHNAFITVDGKKMGKSENNFFTISDLKSKGYNPLAYRYLLLGAHYRSPLNFTFDSLAGAEKSWQKINLEFNRLPDGGEADPTVVSDFMTAINDDLNTAKGLAILHQTLSSDLPQTDKKAKLTKIDEVLGIIDSNFNLNIETVPY